MDAQCEVCLHFRPGAGAIARPGVREITFGKRRVLLCNLHARLTQLVRVTTFEGLRKLFRETRGKRSFLPRRRAEARSPSHGPSHSQATDGPDTHGDRDSDSHRKGDASLSSRRATPGRRATDA